MPPDLRPQLQAEVNRREFRGDVGRHYHVTPLKAAMNADSTASAWLVAEVSDRLVVRPMRASLLEQWLLVELLLLLVAVVLALWIARRIARPLSLLAESVHHLDPAHPTPAIAIAGADREVTQVARALDQLRTRVAAFVVREQAFTRDASHELRTPLSVIRSTTAQALHDPAVPVPTQRLLALALQSAEQMERSVASLLALSRERAGAAAAEPCRVLPVLEDVVLEQSAALDARQLMMEIRVPPDAALVVDAAILHLLLANVLNNAVTHASHGPVCVHWERAELTISNPVAPGAVPDAQTLGVPGTKRASSPGFGFGLSIVQRLCDHAGLQVSWHAREERFAVVISGLGMLAPA
jgi:signal transduction histidine kinase